jgi:hypothetical protein
MKRAFNQTSTQPHPMDRSMRHASHFLVPMMLIAATSAFAQDVYSAPRETADRLCASYGPNFVAGHQPGSCVKVEQRLRVAPAARNQAHSLPPPTAFAPMQSETRRPQLRLQGSFGVSPREH